jgi:Holliday junction resolvase RusA-like endonuclease
MKGFEHLARPATYSANRATRTAHGQTQANDSKPAQGSGKRKLTLLTRNAAFGPTSSGWWLPYPPSSNDFWGHTRTGQTYLKPKGRKYKAAVQALLAGVPMLTGFVRVDLEVVRPRRIGDLDNYLPMVLDACSKRLWFDDRQIVELHAWRLDDAVEPGVMVRAREA